MKAQNLFSILISLFTLGAITTAVAQNSEFSISGNCYNSQIQGLAFDGTNYLAGMVGDLTSDSNVTVQFFSPEGQLKGDRISLGETGTGPAIAFDGTNYLLVWADRYVRFMDNGEDAGMTNIYGRFINPSGNFVGNKFTIVTGAYIKGSMPASIQFNGSNYFIIYKEDNGENDFGPAYGRFISPSGILLGSPFQISDDNVGEISIAPAFDGTNYLIAFVVDSKNIYGQFLSPAGALVGTNFLIDESGNNSQNPVYIVFDGSKYMVVFHDDYNLALDEHTPEWDIFARFVSTSGNVDTNKITICEHNKNPNIPTIAFDGTNFLTSWISMDELRIKGRFFNTNGKPVGDEIQIFDSVNGTIPMGGVALFADNKYLAVCTRINWGSKSIVAKEQIIKEKAARENTNNGIYGKFIEQQTTGITENIGDNSLFKIYPNPASNIITLNINEYENAVLNIYKITGDLVSSGKVTETNPHIYVGNLSAGIYMVEIKTQKSSEKQKLVIQR